MSFSHPVGEAPCSYDHAEALRIFDDSPDACAEIVYVFVENCPTELRGLREAIQDGDSFTAVNLAHKLQDALAILAAKPAKRMAGTIETMVRSGDFEAAARQARLLCQEVEQVGNAMRHAVALGDV